MRSIVLQTALVAALTGAALPAQAGPDLPGRPAAVQVAALGGDLDRLTQRVYSQMEMLSDTGVANYMSDLRKRVLAETDLPEDEWNKVLELRNTVMGQNYSIGTWADWNYDDRELTDAEKALVTKVEKRLIRDPYNPDKVRAALAELKTIMARPEFKQEEGNISDFVDLMVTPRLRGMQLGINRYHFKFFKEWYDTPFRLLKQDKVLDAAKGLEELREIIAIFQSNDLVDITDWTVDAKDADGDPQPITLKEATKRLDDLTATIAKRVEAEKKKRAGEIKKWQTLLKADKAKLYKSKGIPDSWVYVQTGFTTEDAAKSPWWIYYERVSHSYWYRYKHTFNTQQQLTNTERSVVYFPNVP